MKGIIYCVKNPLFPHIVKIGKTTKPTVKERGLDDSNLPEDFQTIFEFVVPDVDGMEKSVHNGCKDLKYISKCGRENEFYLESAIDRARGIVEPLSITEIKPGFNFGDPSNIILKN
jgi:hypothetical protein